MPDLGYVFDPDAPEWPATPDGWFQVGNVTPATVMEANTGPAEPARVREILDAIAVFRKAKKPLPLVLVEFLTQGVEKFLGSDGSTLDAAFGLTATRGRSRTDERVLVGRALHVLKNRLNGMTFQDAVDKAAVELNTSSTRIKQAWGDYREEALAVLGMEKHLDRENWTELEYERVTKIFADKPAHLHCKICNKWRRIRVPEPRAGADLPFRPRCPGCDHEFMGDELTPIRDKYRYDVMRIRRIVQRSVRGVLRQRRGPPRFPQVEWGGARYIQPVCGICGTLQMIAVPAELPDPWDVKCEGCEAVFVCRPAAL